MTVPSGSNCFQYEPGVVLSIERLLDLPQARDVWLSPAEAGVYFPSAGVVFRRYFTPPGDELRVLTELSSRAGVLSASLNYFGRLPGVPKSSISPGELASDSYICTANIEGDADETDHRLVWNEASGYSVKLPLMHNHRPVGVIVDVDQGHARCVSYQFREGFKASAERLKRQDTPCRYVVFSTPRSSPSSADFATFCRLLLAAGELQNPIRVLNLSVDFGQLCDPKGGCDSPEVAVLYSFPFLEACLDEFLAARKRRGDAPVVIAAAGNRLDEGSTARWRLGYPASLPDVLAVTCLEDDSTELSPLVDHPAVGPLKPCFATRTSEFGQGFTPNFPWGVHRKTTSYAAGYFSGHLLALFAADGLTPQSAVQSQPPDRLSTIARLVAQSRPLHIQPPEWIWVPPVVRTVAVKSLGPREGPFTRLLQALNRDMGEEYVLTGSAAFVESWLTAPPRASSQVSLTSTQFQQLLAWVGDLDLLHTGSWPSDSGRLQIRATIGRWAHQESQGAVSGEAIESSAHPLRTWAGGLYLLQCVIPDAQLMCTAGGILDPWDGSTHTQSNSPPRLHVPPASVWRLNPQFRTGIAGIADGLAVYTNRLLLEVLLASFREPFHPPSWLGEALFGFLENQIADPLLRDAILWFGATGTVPPSGQRTEHDRLRNRLDRRLRRTDILIKATRQRLGVPAIPIVKRLVEWVETNKNDLEARRVPVRRPNSTEGRPHEPDDQD